MAYRVQGIEGRQWLANRDELHADGLPMDGVDEFDTVFDPQTGVDGKAIMESCAAGITSPEQLAKIGGVLMASSAGTNCVSDYDKSWPLLVHPEAFPWGCGARPTGWCHVMVLNVNVDSNKHLSLFLVSA